MGDLVRRNVADYIRLTRLERGDARPVFLNRFVNDFVNSWRLAPITLVAPENELAASFPTGKFEWTRSDRPVVRLAHFFCHRLFHDYPAVDVFQGVSIGFLQRQDDGVIVRSVHFRDVLQIGRLKALFVGQYAFEGSEHVSARKLCAVMKANDFTDLELD